MWWSACRNHCPDAASLATTSPPGTTTRGPPLLTTTSAIGEAAAPAPEGPPPATEERAAEESATLRLRVLAFAVDLGWVSLALLVPVLLGTLAGVDSLWVFAVVLGAGMVTYHTVWVWLSGRTPGKAMYNLAVRHGDSVPARTWQGLLWSLGRHSVGYLFADPFGVGFLLALTPRSGRCPHDYVFGSTVVIRATGAERARSLLARLSDYDERLDASIEDRGKRYAPLLSLWKKQTKLLRRVALALIFLLGRSPDSQLGKLWARVQRRIGRWLTHARSPAAAPVRPLSAWARAGLWAVTGGVVAAVAVAVWPLVPRSRPTGEATPTTPVAVGSAGSSVSSSPPPPSGPVAAPIPVGGPPTDGVAVAQGAVRVISGHVRTTLSRIDPATNRVTAAIPVGRIPWAVAVGEGSVWVTDLPGAVYRINP